MNVKLPKVQRRSLRQVASSLKSTLIGYLEQKQEVKLIKCPCPGCVHFYSYPYSPHSDLSFYNMCNECIKDYRAYFSHQPRPIHKDTPMDVLLNLEKKMVAHRKTPVGQHYPDTEWGWTLEALKRARLEEELATKFHPNAKAALRRFWSK